MTSSKHDQFYILNKFNVELERIKQNTIDTNRKNFHLLNRMLETFHTKPVQTQDHIEKKPKTIYEEAEASVRKKTSLKKMEKMKLAMLDNRDLYYKLFKKSAIHKANEHLKMKQHRRQYMNMKSTLLKEKQKQREYCQADIEKQNKRDHTVLDIYTEQTRNIRKRRNIETQKKQLLNTGGFEHLTCTDLKDILSELQDVTKTMNSAQAYSDDSVMYPGSFVLEAEDELSHKESFLLPFN